MIDPTILFIRPDGIKPEDKVALAAVGVIVVEVENPSDVKLVRAHSEIETSTLLNCALIAMKNCDYSSSVKQKFADALIAAFDLEFPKPKHKRRH